MQRSPGFIDHAGKEGLCDGLTERAGEKIVSSFDANVPDTGFELGDLVMGMQPGASIPSRMPAVAGSLRSGRALPMISLLTSYPR